jgi:hypothetical protein
MYLLAQLSPFMTQISLVLITFGSAELMSTAAPPGRLDWWMYSGSKRSIYCWLPAILGFDATSSRPVCMVQPVA